MEDPINIAVVGPKRCPKGGSLVDVLANQDCMTSLGSGVAKADVINFLTFWKTEVARLAAAGIDKQTYKIDPQNRVAVGSFELRYLTSAGDAFIGCELLSAATLAGVAKQLGLG